MVFIRLFAKGLSHDSSVKVKFVFEPNGPPWPAGVCPSLLGMTSPSLDGILVHRRVTSSILSGIPDNSVQLIYTSG